MADKPRTKSRATAKKTPAKSRRQPPVIPESELLTGLVDYGMWVQMFYDRPDEPATGHRQGRIWA